MKRSDVDCIWENFNQVIDERIYLPTFNKVTTEFEKRAWYNEFVEIGNICIVAEDPDLKSPNNVVSQVTIEDIQWEASPHVAVLGVIVRNEYRKVGLGYHLIQFAVNEAKKNRKKKIILSTISSNIDAIRVYEKLGFERIGVRKKHFFMNGEYADELLMEVWISDP
jgi:RimJ/RimL family protein N-acetyltransferase